MKFERVALCSQVAFFGGGEWFYFFPIFFKWERRPVIQSYRYCKNFPALGNTPPPRYGSFIVRLYLEGNFVFQQVIARLQDLGFAFCNKN